MAGNVLGAVIFGYYSDRFGRKTCLITCICLFICLGMGGAWATTTYTIYLVFRFLNGVAGVPLFENSFVLGQCFPKYLGLICTAFFLEVKFPALPLAKVRLD